MPVHFKFVNLRFGIEASIAMGCVFGDGENQRLECLQEVDVETFVRLTSVLGINLKPNEDADYATDPFLPISPMEALRTGTIDYSSIKNVFKY